MVPHCAAIRAATLALATARPDEVSITCFSLLAGLKPGPTAQQARPRAGEIDLTMFGMGDDRSGRERAEGRPRGAGFLAKLLGGPTDRRSGGSERRPARAGAHHDWVATAQDAITEAPGDTPGIDVLVRQFIAQNIVAAKRAPNEYREVDGHVAAIVKAARNRGLEVIRAGDGRYFYLHGVPVGGVRRMVTTMVGHIALTSCASKHVTGIF